MYRLTTNSLASFAVCLLLVAIGVSSHAQEPPADDTMPTANDDFTDDTGLPADPLTNENSQSDQSTSDNTQNSGKPEPIFYRNGQAVEVGSPQPPPVVDDFPTDPTDDDMFPSDDDVLDEEPDDVLDNETTSPDDTEPPSDVDGEDTHAAASTTSIFQAFPIGLIAGAFAGVVVLFVLVIWIFKSKGKRKTQKAIEKSQVAPQKPQPQDTSLRLEHAIGSTQGVEEQEKKEEFRKQAGMKTFPQNQPPATAQESAPSEEPPPPEETPPASTPPQVPPTQ